jgi:alanine racemase
MTSFWEKPVKKQEVLSEGASASLTVRLGVIAANYRELASRSNGAEVAPVVKADAYGVGMDRIAPHLFSLGARSFFVARLKEGIALRRLLPDARIFVFDGLTGESEAAFVTYRLIPVLNTANELKHWSSYAERRGIKLDTAIQIETGMNRAGLSPAETVEFGAGARQRLAGVELVLIMSHLACADEPDHALNRKQLERFRAALAALPSAPASLAATSGISLGREYLFDVVRPGIGLYGGNPQPGNLNPYRMGVSLTAEILQLKQVEPGETVGYGAAFTAERPTTLAIIAAGYADGLIRAAGRKGRAIVAGRSVPFAGRVSMDLAALDVTDVPAFYADVGKSVELLGDGISLEEMADAAGTINHEVLTSITPRTKPIYKE